MKLQLADDNDIETIVDLWRSLALEMEPYSKFNELDGDVQKKAEKGWRKKMKSDKIEVYLVKKDGEVIGFTDLKHDSHSTRDIKRYTKIVDLFIEEEYRSQGIGTEVVDKVKKIAKRKDSQYLKVSSEWHNERARDFYEGNGFTEKQVRYVQELE